MRRVDFNRGKEMIRRTTMLLFAGCLIEAGLLAETAQRQDSAGRTTTKERAATQEAAPGQATPKESTPGRAGEAAAAKSGFPLDEFTEFSAVMVGSM